MIRQIAPLQVLPGELAPEDSIAREFAQEFLPKIVRLGSQFVLKASLTKLVKALVYRLQSSCSEGCGFDPHQTVFIKI